MRARTQTKIKHHFEHIGTAIFWPSDISKILHQHRATWEAWDLSGRDVVDFLLETALLRKAEFTSAKYATVVRYVRGNPSSYRLALSLRRNSFLCHYTALELHGLAPHSGPVYANKEQSDKPEPNGLTQTGINLAFKNQQRRSTYEFQYDEHRYVLISGKNTGRAGVVRMRTHDGDDVDTTDLERTLIDIVVRPAYAGGLEKVTSVYDAAVQKVDVDHLTKLLRRLNYLYPYAQSIGFLLQRAGRLEKELTPLKKLRSEFDFFLDYGMKEPSYDGKWRLYYPASLRERTRAQSA
jgi:hypothetical protein